MVKFLPRSTYENYLLDAKALESLLTQALGLNDVSTERASEWLRAHPSHAKYDTDADWLKNVNGARILEELVSEFSTAKHEYRKTTHSPFLTRWLLANKPSALTELLEHIAGLFSVPASS